MRFTPLPPGGGVADMVGGFDLTGFAEQEHRVAGTARAYIDVADAEFATRVHVRRPLADFSGTVVVEWLNVSGGSDGAADWSFLAPEILRSRHAWVGVSAQYVGIHGGVVAVGPASAPVPGARDADPGRYGDLHHPGDAYSYDIFSQVGRLLRHELGARTLLAVGESQSAYALTTYVNTVDDQPYDGFLVHSRGGTAAPLGGLGTGWALMDFVHGPPVCLRDDLRVPVLVFQTETDVLGELYSFAARQPDTALLRTWEVAGTAHADHYLLKVVEPFLGAADPVNRGQQVFALRAALRHLDRWARGGDPAPSVVPLEVLADGYATDGFGNVLGGVRTPAVDVPVQMLSGLTPPGTQQPFSLFGRTLPLPADLLRRTYASRTEYLERYVKAVDSCIDRGFALVDDYDELLGDARPELLP